MNTAFFAFEIACGIVFALLLVAYIVGELRVHKMGGDVYQWTKDLAAFIRSVKKG